MKTLDVFHGDIVIYASKREAAISGELQLLEKAGEITELRRQVPFVLIPKDGKDRAVKYVADFTWYEHDVFVAADVKGQILPMFKLKARLLLHTHGIRVRILK